MEHFRHRLMAKVYLMGRLFLRCGPCHFLVRSLLLLPRLERVIKRCLCVLWIRWIHSASLSRLLPLRIFWEGLSTLMQDRKSVKSLEQAIKEAEQLVRQASSLEHLESCLCKAAEGMQFQEAKISFYQKSSKLGVRLNEKILQ